MCDCTCNESEARGPSVGRGKVSFYGGCNFCPYPGPDRPKDSEVIILSSPGGLQIRLCDSCARVLMKGLPAGTFIEVDAFIDAGERFKRAALGGEVGRALMRKGHKIRSGPYRVLIESVGGGR